MKINYGPGLHQLGQTVSQIGGAFMDIGMQRVQMNKDALEQKYKADATMAQIEMEKYATTWMQNPENLSPEEGVEAVSHRFERDFMSFFDNNKNALFSDPSQADRFSTTALEPLSGALGIKALEAAHKVYVDQTVTQANNVIQVTTSDPNLEPLSAKSAVMEQLDLLESTIGLNDRQKQEAEYFAAIDNTHVTQVVNSLVQSNMSEDRIFKFIDGLTRNKFSGSPQETQLFEETVGTLSSNFSQDSAKALKTAVSKGVDERDKQQKDSVESMIIQAESSGRLVDIGSLDSLIDNTVERNRLPLVKLKRTATLNNDKVISDAYTQALDSGEFIEISNFKDIQDTKTRSTLTQRSLVNLGMQYYTTTAKGNKEAAVSAIRSSEAPMNDKYEALVTFGARVADEQDFSTESVDFVFENYSNWKNGRLFNFNFDQPMTVEEKDVPVPEVYQALEAKDQLVGLDEPEQQLVRLYQEYEEAPSKFETRQTNYTPNRNNIGMPKVPFAFNPNDAEPTPPDSPTVAVTDEQPTSIQEPVVENPPLEEVETVEAPVQRTKEEIAVEIEQKSEEIRQLWNSNPTLMNAYQAKTAERRQEILFESMTPEQRGAKAARASQPEPEESLPVQSVDPSMKEEEIVAVVLGNFDNGKRPSANELSMLRAETQQKVVEAMQNEVLGVPDISDPSAILALTKMQYDMSSTPSNQQNLADAYFRSGSLTLDDYNSLRAKPSGIQSENYKWLFSHISSLVNTMYKGAPSSDAEARIVNTAIEEIIADPEIITNQDRFNKFKEEISNIVMNEKGSDYLKNVANTASAMNKSYSRQIQDQSVSQFLQMVRKGDYDYALDFGALRDVRMMVGKTDEEIQNSLAQHMYGKSYEDLTYDFEKKRVDINATYLGTSKLYQSAMDNTFGLKGKPHLDVKNKRWVYEDPENPGVFFTPMNLDPSQPGSAEGVKWGLFTAPKTNGVYDFSKQSGLTLLPEYLDPELHSNFTKDSQSLVGIEERTAKREEEAKRDKSRWQRFVDNWLHATIGAEGNTAHEVMTAADEQELTRIKREQKEYEEVMGYVLGIRKELAKGNK